MSVTLSRKRLTLLIASPLFVLPFQLTLVIIFLIAVIIYRSLVTIPMYRDPSIRSQADIFASLTGGFLNLILIMTLGRIYQILAVKMTEWGKCKGPVTIICLEMHETQTDFETFLTVKVFLFQFVNYYASIFYIAFFKGRCVKS